MTRAERSTMAAGFAMLALALGCLIPADVFAAPERPSGLTDVAANDNTAPGGRLTRGVLHLDLVARRGLFYPDGPGTLGLPIEAFGEAGAPLRIPGPLVRVPLGTRVVASVHNALSHDLTVRGLGASSNATLLVRRGATRNVSFVLENPGTFGYYGSDTGESIGNRIFGDAELSGAVVVDAPHAKPIDHVFVIGVYAPVKRADGSANFIYFLETINGRSYPATEHLTYVRGQTVRWGVYNASALTHPMHLHGFYFRDERPSAYDQNTQAFRPGESHQFSFTVDRAGDWMYHCHVGDHITPHAPLADMRAGKADPQLTVPKRYHLPNAAMAGMMIAIKVLPRPGDRVAAAPAAPRRLALDVSEEPAPDSRFALNHEWYTLKDGDRTIPPTGALGPAIVLTQGQPVAIAVTNHLSESTSVHWHGIALEDSYYDGGADMGMSMPGGRMPPPIAPGKTFVARFTPPDAGTFMYHSHLDGDWQTTTGLVGPLIVLPRGQTFDPKTDHIVMISETPQTAGGPPLAIDGVLAPPPMNVTVGVPQRLRFSDLTLAATNLVVSVSDGTRVIRWIPISKDGRAMPARLQRATTATSELTIGETRDFRFTPTQTGTLLLGVYDLDNNGALVASQKIVVSAPSVANAP